MSWNDVKTQRACLSPTHPWLCGCRSCFHAGCQRQPWVGCLPTWGAFTFLPWTDPSSAWPLSAATALSLGGEESGQCCEVLWQGGCCVHLLCLRVAAPLTALVTSCRVPSSEALQTILPLSGGITGMCTWAFPLAWNDSYYQHENRRWGRETNPYAAVLS